MKFQGSQFEYRCNMHMTSTIEPSILFVKNNLTSIEKETILDVALFSILHPLLRNLSKLLTEYIDIIQKTTKSCEDPDYIEQYINDAIVKCSVDIDDFARNSKITWKYSLQVFHDFIPQGNRTLLTIKQHH